MKACEALIVAISLIGTCVALALVAGCAAPVAGGLVGKAVTTDGCPVSPRWAMVDYERYPGVIVSHLPRLGPDGGVMGYVTAVCVDGQDARSLNPLCCEAFPEVTARFLGGDAG